MEKTIIDVMHECAEGSHDGSLTFPMVVGKLMACDVESYHADLRRSEMTFYMPNGESHVETQPYPEIPVGAEFSADDVSDAVHEIQQGRLTYREFVRRIMTIGTTQYFVYLAGKCAVYVGRDGSQHVEYFPKR